MGGRYLRPARPGGSGDRPPHDLCLRNRRQSRPLGCAGAQFVGARAGIFAHASISLASCMAAVSVLVLKAVLRIDERASS
jgi:hypothetical protein